MNYFLRPAIVRRVISRPNVLIYNQRRCLFGSRSFFSKKVEATINTEGVVETASDSEGSSGNDSDGLAMENKDKELVQQLIIYLTALLIISNACWRANACHIITFLMKIMDFGWKILCFLTKTPNPNLVSKNQIPEP